MRGQEISRAIYSQDTKFSEGEAHGWIQWKGTNVCMDVHCACGEISHVDAYFFYYFQCPYCDAKYAVGQNVRLILLTPEQQEDADRSSCGFVRPESEYDQIEREAQQQGE